MIGQDSRQTRKIKALPLNAAVLSSCPRIYISSAEQVFIVTPEELLVKLGAFLEEGKHALGQFRTQLRGRTDWTSRLSVVARTTAPRRPSEPKQKEDGQLGQFRTQLKGPVFSVGVFVGTPHGTLSPESHPPRRPPNKPPIRLGAFLDDEKRALGRLGAFVRGQSDAWAPVGPLTYGDQSDRREEGGDVWDIDCRKKRPRPPFSDTRDIKEYLDAS
ncbi:hypothetical protein DFH09DRAFT_1075880 [Mycena vulgaris]|nr:hypothetical protein DFH09DRAFT_1075880 [Mycena vulgaris]